MKPPVNPFPSRSHAAAACAAVLMLMAATPSLAFQRDGGDRQGFRQGRDISDQEHARSQRELGQNRSFEELLHRAQTVGRGQYLGVEPDISRNIYRFKFVRPGGNVVWVDMDGRTGRELSIRQ